MIKRELSEKELEDNIKYNTKLLGKYRTKAFTYMKRFKG